MTWLRKLWPLALGIIGLVIMTLLGRRNGQLNEQIKRAEARDHIKERMRDATANTRRDRPAVVDRLRDGRF